MRAYLRDIFAEAVDQDFLVKDPARKVKVPTQLRETNTTNLTWDQLRSALNALGRRDRLLLELDMTNALRPSELFALKWKCFDSEASAMSVTETVYKGNIRPWGEDEEEPLGHSYSRDTSSRSRSVEIRVSQPGARSVHLRQSGWEFH